MSPPIALVNMPFFAFDRPNLGLSLLKAGLAERGIESRIHYLNLAFADHIGPKLYRDLVEEVPETHLACEWIFTSALWGADPARDERYLQQVIRGESEHHRSWDPPIDPLTTIEMVVKARESVDTFLDDCLESVPWDQYVMVGFSSVFQQQIPTLALAERLKAAYPDLFIILGGANCEGPMGVALLDSFSFIDAVCLGEGDVAFPELVAQRLAGSSECPAGILVRDPSTGPEASGRAQGTSKKRAREKAEDLPAAEPINDMDGLPYPQFDDFFVDRAQTASQKQVPVTLTFETSRGCWWGHKSHCTFCGLNGQTMRFRQKSADRATAEIMWLLERHGSETRRLSAVDNIIPMNYFKTFLPQLRDLDLDLDLFYETKANLRQDQIELYSDVGLKKIQPGIESLSTPILKLMRKGVTALQNVRLLKWCKQAGVQPLWNFLVGFPGESPEDYEAQLDLVRSLFHLQPPAAPGVSRVRFDRFSPYLNTPEAFGVRDLHAYPSYSHIYPGLPPETLDDIAYYFVGDFDAKAEAEEYTLPLRRAIRDWIREYDRCALFSTPLQENLLICDFRPGATQPFFVLVDWVAAIHESCDDIVSRKNLGHKVSQALGREVSEPQLDDGLSLLVERRLLATEGDQFLNLTVPLGSKYQPNPVVMERFQEARQELRKAS